MAKEIELPADLADRIGGILADHPEMSWDQAAAQILAELIG
jgi:hypothetical protein